MKSTIGSRRRLGAWWGAWLAIGLAVTAASPAHAIKMATWNLLFYDGTSVGPRQPYFRTVMAALDPDVLICQEINPPAGVDSFYFNVLDVIQPGQWNRQWTTVGGEGMAIFWKPAKVTAGLLGSIAINAGRDVAVCSIRPVGYGGTTFIRVYSMHLKAGTALPTTTDSTTRRMECTELRNALNTNPSPTPFILGGDTNFYGAWEGGYQRLTESQLDNDGRGKDLLTMPGTWNTNSAYAAYDTQSPCLSAGCPGSTGGMDDRFDLWLTSASMQDGEGFDVVPGAYGAFGNDGQHFNNDINADGFNNAVGYTVATALRQASDHLPVLIVFQVPAKVAAASSLDFGDVIVEGTPTANLTVANSALAPADELTYSMTASSGFTAPSGTFNIDAGVAGNVHTITMDASSEGYANGTVTIASDDPDSASKMVLVSAHVLRHAIPSLDSLTVTLSRTLDFGTHPMGQFLDGAARVHNVFYDSEQARLSLAAATITGGAGRFSIAGGFTPSLVAGVARTLPIHFNDIGATPDSTYQATLTFQTADEPLQGAVGLDALQITLRAHATANTDAPGAGLPSAIRFAAPRPNPLVRTTRFGFDLPSAARVSLEVFDLSGRRVATVTDQDWTAGRHELPWRADGPDGSPLSGGLYFARFHTRGLDAVERIIVLP